MPTGIVLIVVGGIVGLGVITVFSLLAWSGRWDSKPLRDIDIVFYLQRDAILSSDRAAERATAAKTHSDAKDPDAIRDAYRHVLLLERLGRAEALKRLRTQAFEQGKLRDFALLSQAIDCWALWEAEDNWKLGLGKRGSTIVTDPAIVAATSEAGFSQPAWWHILQRSCQIAFVLLTAWGIGFLVHR